MKRPIYYIVCHKWNTEIDDYDFTVYCQSTDVVEIHKVFDSIQPCKDIPLVELYLQGEDTDERVAYKEY